MKQVAVASVSKPSPTVTHDQPHRASGRFLRARPAKPWASARRLISLACVVVVLLCIGTPLAKGKDAAPSDKQLAGALKTIVAVGPKGAGHIAARDAWQNVAAASADQLTAILTAMDNAGPLATNYLRAAVDAIAERELKATGKLPTDTLEKFLLDTRRAPRARRLAYEWLVRVQPTTADHLMPKMLDDRSLELRRDAVQRVIDEAAAAKEKPAQLAAYRRALASVRDLDQVKTISEALKKLGEEVDIARQLGFILEWQLIGPFDNSNQKGFNIAYPPEKQIDFAATYDGKEGKVAWQKKSTDDAYGTLNLNEVLDKHKGAIAYAAAEFNVDQARKVQIRLGCINANKVWVNGKLVTANEVYHANTNVDQYIADAELKKGKNTILVKVCQNEQKESWAQRWQFQLRVTDSLGGAVAAK